MELFKHDSEQLYELYHHYFVKHLGSRRAMYYLIQGPHLSSLQK